MQDINTDESWFSVLFSFQKHSRFGSSCSIFSSEDEDVPSKLSGFLAFYKFSPVGAINLVGLIQESTSLSFKPANPETFWHSSSITQVDLASKNLQFKLTWQLKCLLEENSWVLSHSHNDFARISNRVKEPVYEHFWE